MNRLVKIATLFALTNLCIATYADNPMPVGDDSQGISQYDQNQNVQGQCDRGQKAQGQCDQGQIGEGQYDQGTVDETIPESTGTWRLWVCSAENSRGMHFKGRGYNRYEARERALRECYEHSRRCHIVGCWLR